MESTTESELSNTVQQLDSLVQRVESIEVASKLSTEILPGFPDKISGEIIFCTMVVYLFLDLILAV